MEIVDYHENAIGLPADEAQTASNISVKACWARFDALRLMVLEAAVTLPVLLVVSFVLRRKARESRCCLGLAGVACPWDCLKYAEGRVQCVLAICLLTFPAYLLISESTAIFSVVPDGSWLRTPLELAAVLAAGLCLHPILLSATMPSVLTHCIALLVAATQTTIAVLPLALCVRDLPLASFVLPILYLLPSVLAGTALVFVLSCKIARLALARSRRQLLPSVAQPLPEAYLCEKAEYVRNLLRKRKSEKSTEEKRNAFCRVYAAFKSARYTPTAGFYYPITLQCSLVSSLLLLYFMALKAANLIFSFDSTVTWLNAFYLGNESNFNVTVSVQQAFAVNVMDGQFNFDSLSPSNAAPETSVLVRYLLGCFVPISIGALCLATLNGVAVLLFIFVNYKQNVLRAYRGNYGHFSHRTELEPLHALIGLCQYGGYQVGYTAWAAFLQFLAYLVLFTFVWYTVLLPLIFGFDIWFIVVTSRYWPMLVIAVAHEFVQFLAARFAFVAHGGKWLAVRNRRVFQVWSYYAFLTNCIMGLVSCLLRLMVAFTVSFVFLARLDWCNLPPRFRFLDNGHFAYMGQLHADVCHSHPVLVTFVELLKSEARKAETLRRAHSQDCKQCALSDEANSPAHLQLQNRKRKNYKIKWLVAYAKVSNPALQQVCKWNRDK